MTIKQRIAVLNEIETITESLKQQIGWMEESETPEIWTEELTAKKHTLALIEKMSEKV